MCFDVSAVAVPRKCNLRIDSRLATILSRARLCVSLGGTQRRDAYWGWVPIATRALLLGQFIVVAQEIASRLHKVLLAGTAPIEQQPVEIRAAHCCAGSMASCVVAYLRGCMRNTAAKINGSKGHETRQQVGERDARDVSPAAHSRARSKPRACTYYE